LDGAGDRKVGGALPVLEELDCPLMLLRRGSGLERAKVAASSSFGVEFAGIEAILT
jgi:hypothetical protein